MRPNILELISHGPVLGDGGYLLELERRGYVDSGSEREKVGTGRGSGQFTPEVAIEHPEVLRGLHQEFLLAGSQVLQALTFFGTREKLSRAGYGEQTEEINRAAVQIVREVAGDKALVGASVSRTQLLEREGVGAMDHARDLLQEQIRLLHSLGVDFLILETFFRLDEMLVALDCARETGLPLMATMSFRPLSTQSTDGHSPAGCARAMVDHGAQIVGANCEQEPARMLPILREMRSAVDATIAGQPAAFHTTDEMPSFTRMPQFPDDLETIQVSRRDFFEFARIAVEEGVGFVGGCCGCNASYVRSMARGLHA